MGFSSDVKIWTAKAADKARIAVGAIALGALRSVVLKSPVGNPDLWKHPVPNYVGGRFRGNWQLEYGAPANAVLDTKDQGGGDTISKGAEKITGRTYLTDESIFITNHLLYALALEYGHSTQAPGAQAIVGRTVLEIQDASDRFIADEAAELAG